MGARTYASDRRGDGAKTDEGRNVKGSRKEGGAPIRTISRGVRSPNGATSTNGASDDDTRNSNYDIITITTTISRIGTTTSTICDGASKGTRNGDGDPTRDDGGLEDEASRNDVRSPGGPLDATIYDAN